MHSTHNLVHVVQIMNIISISIFLAIFMAHRLAQQVGKAAAIAERDGNGPAQQVVTLEVDALDADASGYEPVWKDGEKVGFVTSGGYGHTMGKSYAMAMVNSDACAEGTDLSVHIVGVERAAKVIAPSPYDPAGKAMRG